VFSFTSVGYNNYTVLMFILSGWMILRFDAKRYRMADMKKERKTASVIGWVNIVLGVIGFAGYKIAGMLLQ
jgi:uncharacterized membrane protein